MRPRKLKDYLKPVHDNDCGIYRNVGMSPLAAEATNYVYDLPTCTCGLEKVRDAAS